MFKKLFSLFAALTLSVGLWAETVSYLYPVYNEGDVTKGIKEWKTTTVEAAPISSSSSTWGAADQETWLVVNENVTISERVTCEGDVHIILADGAKLNATQGITVSGADKLTIYAQTTGDQMGQLKATGGYFAAGIGGGYNSSGSDIVINGGIVTATGGNEGAGIGGGSGGDGTDITINGGDVTATCGGYYAAGIGGGKNGSGSNITINGGEVTATGASSAAGIGGGNNGSGSNITINGGEVTATGGNEGAGIGGGNNGSGSNIFVATSLVIKAGDSPNPTTVITNTGADLASSLAGKRYATIEPAPTSVSTTYLDENGETQNIDAWEVKNTSKAVTWGTAGQTTWFVVNGTNVQLAKGAVCAGDVRLILADNAKLTATGWDDETYFIGYAGIQVSGEGNSLTIYAQSVGEQMGQLIATGGEEAIGGSGAAGIGGGSWSDGSDITINGGIVTANGASKAAGIGGGGSSSGSNITINGGEVEATGGSYGAGIGGGYYGLGSNITINGGTVTANGVNGAAGIGGGYRRSGSDITINGGIVTANGGVDAAGIGSGAYDSGSASNIYISDAYVLKAGADKDNTEVIAHSSAQDLGGTLTQRYVKAEGLATPYTRTVTANSWGTVCLPYAVTDFSSVTFYKVNYYNASENALYVEEVTALAAGMPYIFEATEDGTLTINHSATAPMAYSAVGKEGGLYGSFARTTLAYDADHAYAAISGGSVVIAGDGNTVTVPACRAYLDMNEVATSEQPHKAPLRAMGVPRQQPTNNENVNADGNMNGKFVINGQFVIVKDGKKINALGF